MEIKQNHSSTGDNVAGNKYEFNSNATKGDINSIITTKISQIKNSERFDFSDSNVLTALKEVVRELIEEEQAKSHQIVPIGNVRTKFKTLFEDSTFDYLLKELLQEGSIEIQETQICFATKQIDYKINI